VRFRGKRVPVSALEQGLPRIGAGAEIERSAQVGLTKVKFSSFDGGLARRTGIVPWGSALNEFTMNQGIQTRLPGLAILPYRLVGQPTLDDTDHSLTVGLNIRGHPGNTSLGTTGLRHVYFVKNLGFTDTSLTNPAMVELASTPFTDIATAIEPNAVFNNVPYFAVAYNGATQDIRGFTDVTTLAYNTGWTTLVALSAGDYVNAMRYMPTLGPGCMVYVGMIGGTNQVWYTLGTDAEPATAKASVLAATKDILGSLAVVSTGALALTEEEDGSNGGVSWGTDNAPQTYNYLWGSDPATDAVPLSAYIEGLTWTAAFTENGTAGINYTAKTFVNGSAAGIGTAKSRFSSGTDTFGSSTNRLGTNLRGSDLRGIALRIEADLTNSAGAGNDFEYGAQTLNVTYRMPGTSLAFPNGGWQAAPSAAFPNRIAMVAPERTDKTTINVPRKLWFIDFEWDTSGARPVFTPSVPATNMAYIHHAVPYQGGYAITGGSVAGPGKFVRHIDGNSQLRNLFVPNWNGKEWRCNHLEVSGSYLIATW